MLLLVPTRQRPGMLASMMHRQGRPTIENYLVQNVNSAKAEQADPKASCKVRTQHGLQI